MQVFVNNKGWALKVFYAYEDRQRFDRPEFTAEGLRVGLGYLLCCVYSLAPWLERTETMEVWRMS